MPRTETTTTALNALRIVSISTDTLATEATIAYLVGVATDTPILTDGVQTGVETSFTAHPEFARATSATLSLDDASNLGTQKNNLIGLALVQEGLDLTKGDRVLTD